MGLEVGGERELGLEKVRIDAQSSEGRRFLSILSFENGVWV